MQAQSVIPHFSHLVYRKLPSGQYEKFGELPIGCRKVRIDIDARPGCSIYSAKKALRVISEAIMTNHATADVYEIVPLIVDPPELVAKRIENLSKARTLRRETL